MTNTPQGGIVPTAPWSCHYIVVMRGIMNKLYAYYNRRMTLDGPFDVGMHSNAREYKTTDGFYVERAATWKNGKWLV